MEDLPFVAEYAKSSRSSCKICKQSIQKDSLRMGIMVQSPKFDGKIPLWHHSHCFFEKKQVKTTADIANFSNLRWDDQNSIKDKIEKGSASSSKSKAGSSENTDFAIEYAKSSRSTCKVCSEKIMKGEIRISKLDTESSEARRFGPIPQWRHLDCFVKIRQELGFVESGERLPGFKNLSDEDKEDVREKITGTNIGKKRSSEAEQPPRKKKKTEITKEELEFKVQNQSLYDMRDKLKDNLKKKHMIELLEFNKQHISTGESNLLDNLADCMVFGALKMCPECKDGTPRFKNDAYRCAGNLTEWTKCQYVTKYPERKLFKIPEEMQEEFDFLKEYKCVIKERMFPEVAEVNNKKGLPLENFKVAVFGKFKNVPKSLIVKKVEELGGTIQAKVNSSVNVCITTEDEMNKQGTNVTKASNHKIHVVSVNFLEEIKKGATPAIAIKENLLCTWGDDPVLKFGIKQENKVSKKEVLNDSAYAKSSKSTTMKITVNGGAAAVDPDSGMEYSCHVYEKKDEVYNVVLGKVDITRGTNTYYKLQILKSNKGASYWLFRSWGRVGTTIGDKKCEKLKLEDAISEFKRLYLEKTGNDWSNRKNFKKQPGLLYPLEIDYGQECEQFKELKPGDNSKLAKPVQELICLIFDIEAMKKAMVEFEIDLKKMPLGKLSKRQIESAYTVLNEAQQVLLTGCNSAKILDASNRFYTLIPHDFGLKKPPLLDNEELIKSKIEMLDSLLEIEFAYNLLKEDGGITTKDPIDEHYEKLATDIEVLNKDTDEYKYIKDYLHKTHGKTHDMYSLKLNEVFKINRHNERQKYKKFEKLHNKKLLWHGSRLTNYVGILSQGLRIAPPEAPVTGYMFGKGIYFADMVSKSANYCFTSKQNSTGLLLLCEVALGNMYEKTHAEYVTQLPPDKHSTKGLGHTIPDPNDKVFLGDVEIPYGKPVASDVGCSSLLYNEYIVYDVNQVNIKYLLKVNFKFKV